MARPLQVDVNRIAQRSLTTEVQVQVQVRGAWLVGLRLRLARWAFDLGARLLPGRCDIDINVNTRSS